MRFLSWLGSVAPSEAAVRREIWDLGARHRGEPLAGALTELGKRDVSPSRQVLLRACIQKLRG
jgi:hypothetical protein